MSAQTVKKLSVNFPAWYSFYWLVACYAFLSLAREQLNGPDPEWLFIVFAASVIVYASYFVGRFWFSPTVSFDENGVYIARLNLTTSFVPFENVTRLKLISPVVDVDLHRKYKKFDLYYKDETGGQQKARFMLHFSRGIIDAQIPIHSFLKHAKEANKDFDFDHAPFWGPHH